MAKLQTSTTTRRRFFAWFGRHKVASAFVALVLLGALYLFGSWAVLQVQIHFERERFQAAKEITHNIGNLAPLQNLYSRSDYSECAYSSNGAVFATKYLTCDVGTRLIYTTGTRDSALGILHELHAIINQHSIETNFIKSKAPAHDLGTYDFKAHSLGCILASSYYDKNTAELARENHIPNIDMTEVIVIDCGGGTKAEYFPLASN